MLDVDRPPDPAPPQPPSLRGWNTGCLSAGASHKTCDALVVAPWIQTSINGSPKIVCHPSPPPPASTHPAVFSYSPKMKRSVYPLRLWKPLSQMKKEVPGWTFAKRNSVLQWQQPGKKKKSKHYQLKWMTCRHVKQSDHRREETLTSPFIQR